MEWPKLKNIIILILLLANLFMLSMVLIQERDAAQYQKQALDNAVSVLENNGIHMDRHLIPDEMELNVLTVERDLETEKTLAEVLLGTCEVSELGGGRYAYESSLGSAEFRSNGNFSITFLSGTRSTRKIGGEEEHAQVLLKEAGLTAEFDSREEVDGRVVLTYHQTWQNTPVHSCVLTVEYESGILQSMSGLRLLGTPQSGNDKSEPISAPTALMRILNGINDLGDICNEITAMEPGYLMSTATETIRLIPVWNVTTDTGAYSLNALTGVLERA